jgi:hypothetical protein
LRLLFAKFLGGANMGNKKIDNPIQPESCEGVTRDGEWVPTYHVWVSPDKQREKAEKLQNCCDENKSSTK